MSNHTLLDPKQHQKLGVLEQRSGEIGDDAMCCVTFPEEFRSLQSHYPILFQFTPERDEVRCVVLMGLEDGENLFLKNGIWDARYIPLAMDVKPFMIGLPDGEQGNKKVVINLDSPRVSQEKGRRLFDDGGVMTPFLDMITKKLGYLDQGYQHTKNYIDVLQEHELLEPLSIDVKLKDGCSKRLFGFHTIHQEKLDALDGKGLEDLNSKNYLLPTYMALASLSNLADIIERKNRLLEDG